MQLQNKQASRPLHVHTTLQPPSKKLLYVKCTRHNANLWNKKIKKSGIGHKIFKDCIRQVLLKNNNKIENKEIY